MNYLYGDSTQSPLKSNFLEFLRDAVDFAVFALQTDEQLAQTAPKIRALGAEAEAEIKRLERYAASFAKAISDSEKGSADSATAKFAIKLGGLIKSAQTDTVEEIRRELGRSVATLEAQAAPLREACRAAFAHLLTEHQPHGATTVTRLTIAPAGAANAYEGQLASRSQIGLDWSFTLAVAGTMWNAPVRLETLAPQLEARTPQLAAWLQKSAKGKPEKLDRLMITELTDDGTRLTLKLRVDRGIETGFNLSADNARISMSRVGSTAAAVGTFDVQPEDAPQLLLVVEKLRAGLADLKRGTLRTASIEGLELGAQPSYVDFVRRFLSSLAPIVKEISERSVTTNELVLRRSLGNDRREELFVSKDTLRAKYTNLPRHMVDVFAALGLDSDRRMSGKPAATSGKPDHAPLPRSEVSPSRPPSAMPPTVRINPIAPPAPAVSQKPTPPAQMSAAVVPPPPSSNSLINSPPSSNPLGFSAHETPTAVASRRSHELAGNEALVAALKKIALLARNGKTDDAYREYAQLYTSQPFANYRPEDQRQAVRLMLLAKAPPTMSSDAVFAAHHAAIARLEELIAKTNEPADYELLGVACAVLGDADAAMMALETGLEIERTRNLESPLMERLKKRLTALQ